MHYIKIENNRLDEKQLQLVIENLQSGKIIVYPTETAYGIGCDAFNKQAVSKIFKIKNRPLDQPLPIIVDSIQTAKKIAFIDKIIAKLSAEFHPGPLVIATKKKKKIPDIVNKDGIAFRISKNYIVQQITEKLQRPLISTSANISGGKTPYSIADVLEQILQDDLDIIIDSGTLPEIRPSTLIDFQMKPKPQIIRIGEISAEQLFKTLQIKEKEWKNHIQNKK